MGQKSDKYVQSDSVDDSSGVYKQSTPALSTANTDGETNDGFWRRIAGQAVNPEFEKNLIFTTFSDPLFPMFLGLESNSDAVQNPVAGELDWDFDIQLEYNKDPSVNYYSTYDMDEMLSESVLAGTGVQDGLKVENPADGLQTPVHSQSDDDIQYPDDPWFDVIDDRGGDQIQPLPLILLSHENLEDDEDPKVKTDTIVTIEINGRRYDGGRILGLGHFGAVYEATRVQDGLKVALKLIKKTEDVINIPGYPEPLPREIGLHLLATSREHVPVIIELLDWQNLSEYIIMVLECPSPCEDGFDFMIRNGGSVTENIAQVILGQTTEAAEICCKREVFHRDIKLQNLLINPNTLEVKLIDFGCGDLLKTSTYEEYMGTRIYACPEFFKTGEYHGKPATVYSLGVLLFAMVSGNFPSSADLDQINEKTWSKDDLTKECCDLIQACLQPNPDKRIHLETILDHAWFKTAGSDVSDDEGDQIPSSHSMLLSQENLEDDEDPKVTTEIEINGRQYKIGRMLGKGRLGDVYEATRVQDGLTVALKVVVKTEDIIQDYINIPGYPEPLPREIGLHLRASMGGFVPVMVQLLGWQDHPDHYVMVLECPSPCEDGVRFMIHNGGSVTENIAQAIFGQTTEAAEICRKRGVFHRDIKLQNLLINPNTLEVKLIDFGCGDLLKTSTYEEYMGTRIYACPEFFKTGEYHGKPATVYSLGVLLFAMVCGNFPSSADLDQINEKTWSKDDLTKECCDLIQACLQPNPDKRIHLEDILYHAWFEVENPTNGLQTPVHSRSDDDVQYPDDPGFDLIDDGGDQILSSHSISLSQEKPEDDEDPKVTTESYSKALPREIGHLLASMGGFVPVIIQLLGWQDPSPCEDVMSFIDHNGGSVTENIAQAILGQATEAAEI